MTTSELIMALQQADPSGQMEVLVHQPEGNYGLDTTDVGVYRVSDLGEELPSGSASGTDCVVVGCHLR